MNSELRRQIYNNMNLRETDELLGIWQSNDRVEWTETTFLVIKEILESRDVEIPKQGEPINELEIGKVRDENYGFTEMELKIIDDENPPDFYDPFDVLEISKWIDVAAKASIIIVIVLGLTELPRTQNIVMSYFANDQMFVVIGTLIAFGIFGVGVALQIAVTYFPLRALADILKVLMEMEFNSRKAKL